MARQLSAEMTVTYLCPETLDEVEVEIEIHGFFYGKGRDGGWEDVHGWAHGQEIELNDHDIERAIYILESLD